MFYKIIILLLLIYISVFSQGNVLKTQSDKFYFDAVVFEGDSIGKSRVDSYFIIPYENIDFSFVNNIYIAQYILRVNILDSNGSVIQSKDVERKLSETDYAVSKGINASFDHCTIQLYLHPGKYKIEAIMRNQFNNTEESRKREINVIDFKSFNFSMSGILLLSSLEEVNGKYKITPHISDNIGNLENGFFLFFESYNQSNKYDSLDYVWEVYDSSNELIAFSNRIRKANPIKTSRNFVRVPPIKELITGSYTISLLALEPLDIKEYSKESALAKTTRSIRYIKTIAGNIMTDLNLAIKQLRYVATRDEIEYIQTAANEQEKQKRFEDFWKKLDPTPNTERNESFDEYYSRINIANQKFKAFQEGWLSDMGMVYITLGPPSSQEQQSGYGDNKKYERWLYGNGREFIFMDNTGFGDFRLIRPSVITEKYKYNNR